MTKEAQKFSRWFKSKLFKVGLEESPDGKLIGIRKVAASIQTVHGRLRHIYHNLPTGLAAFFLMFCILRKQSGESWEKWGKELDEIFLDKEKKD